MLEVDFICSINFISQNGQDILSHEALIIEGYFIKEKFELCKKLCEEFIKLKKFIILTLSDPFMTEFHKEQIIEIGQSHPNLIEEEKKANLYLYGIDRNDF